MTPFTVQWNSFYNMPQKQYEHEHKFSPYFVIGQLDYTKEVLIPKDRVIDGKTQKGFDVINPLYCYDGGRFSIIKMGKSDSVTVDRAAIIINRGWIPYELKNKKNRPWETNSNKLVKLHGCFHQSENVHYYSKPNNPDNNEWYNLAPHDIATFWDLPNRNELKQFYFQAVDLRHEHETGGVNIGEPVRKWPRPLSKDGYIREYYQWWCHEQWNRGLWYSFGGVSAFSSLLFFLSL